MKQKIVFFGSGWYTIPVIEKLIPHGLDLVITTEKSGPITSFCSQNNIKTISATNSKQLNSQFSILNSQFSLGVLASYGVLIPDSIINSFTNGMINIHPSLLPKYKGPSPIQYQLLNGETTVGVTIIKMDDEFDHGPILSQKPYELQGDETSEDLLSILFEIGADMVKDQIIKLENGEKLIETPQDHSKGTWSEEITKKEGQIDLSHLPTSELEIENWKLEIERRVRAFHPWPGVWTKTTLKGQEKIIKLLPDNKIQVEGKSPMSYKDFINGFGQEGKVLLEKLQLN